MNLNQQPQQDPTNLDFTTPEDKIGDLKKRIAAAEKGIEIAKNLKDQGRVTELQKTMEGFKETLVLLDPSEKTSERPKTSAELAKEEMEGSYDWSKGAAV